jgi:hypothetical protein
MASGPKPDTPKYCNAYTIFTTVLKDIETHYSHLNPNNSAGSRLVKEKGGYSTQKGNRAIQEYIKGGFVRIMASWEAYINDVMEEAFVILLDIVGEGDLSTLKGQWSHCQSLIQDAFKARTDKKPESMAAEAFECMLDTDSWRTLLREKGQQLLSKMNPFFHGDDGIDATFQKLFSPKKSKSGATNVASGGGQQWVPPKEVASGGSQQRVPPKNVKSKNGQLSLSETMASFSGAYEHFYKPRSQQDSLTQQRNGDPEKSVLLADPATLCDILRLYYGVRCVLAHGKSEKTFKAGGALHKFDAFKLEVPVEVREHLAELYRRINNDRSHAQIDYHTLLSAERFLWRMARLMMLAIAEYFHSEFKVLIWKYDPHRKSNKSSIGSTKYYLNRKQ